MGAPRARPLQLRDHGSQPLDAVLRSAPESAATGRPLPRVTVTDPRSPSSCTSPADPGRHRLISDGAVPARRPTSTHDDSRLDPPPTARVQRADPPGRRRRVRRRRPADRNRRRDDQQVPPVPGGDAPTSPGSLTGSGPGPWRPCGHGECGTPEVTGPVRAAPGAGRRWTTSPGPWVPPPAGRRALPGSPRGRPPRPSTSLPLRDAYPGARPLPTGRNAGRACARHVLVEGTFS
jgi:hypothetical protein